MPLLRDVPADSASPVGPLAPAVIEAAARASHGIMEAAKNPDPPLRGHRFAGEPLPQRLEIGRCAVEDVENGATELGLEVVDGDVHGLPPADCRRCLERRVRAGVVERRDEPVAIVGRERIAIQGRHGGEPTV